MIIEIQLLCHEGSNYIHYIVQSCFVQTGLHWWYPKLVCGHIQSVKVILFVEFEAVFCQWTRLFNRAENPLFQAIINNKIICHQNMTSCFLYAADLKIDYSVATQLHCWCQQDLEVISSKLSVLATKNDTARIWSLVRAQTNSESFF